MTFLTSSMVTTCSTPGIFLRGAGVDRLDPAVRHGAAEYLGMQHAGQAHGVGVFGAAGDLVAAFEARHRAADLRADLARLKEGRDIVTLTLQHSMLRGSRAGHRPSSVRACRRPSRARRR